MSLTFVYDSQKKEHDNSWEEGKLFSIFQCCLRIYARISFRKPCVRCKTNLYSVNYSFQKLQKIHDLRVYFRAYRLDEDEGLLLYLDHLFIPPDDAVYVNTSNRASILSKAKTTVNQIIRKDELLKRLQKLYYRTSSYDYETLEFILDVMQELDDTEDIPLEKVL